MSSQNLKVILHSLKNSRHLLWLLFTMISAACLAEDSSPAAATNSFPSLSEVFQGRTFPDKLERDVFFLRAIHDRYPAHWPDLLDANISLEEYIGSPAKLLQFINELGSAMAGRDDPTAATNLVLVISDERFFTNTDAYHPEILRAAAQSLMQLGPNGRRALAACFNENHYRLDPESLEELAKTIGEAQPADSALAKALAATAFHFSTTNGGSYPRCTTEAVKNLLRLPGGFAEVRTHLTTNEIFADPIRFQAVIDGMTSTNAVGLRTNLAAVDADIKAKLVILTNHPGEYRTALNDLDDRVRKTIELLATPK
jgi:hypothetical protein